MIVAVASGKGGTGKTTVSASLASVWPSPVVAVDLDVEEPNLHLFMNPDISAQVPSYIEITEIDDEKCTRCRACTDICQFKAIGIFGEVVMTSGLGGRFPVGYQVAVVSEVERDPGQPFARVLARPSAALDRSRHVLLVFSAARAEER